MTESEDVTGTKTLLRVLKEGKQYLWEPFSTKYKGVYNTSRNLYKNVYGNKVIFEEINHDLELTFVFEWNSSNIYGFVKKSSLINNAALKNYSYCFRWITKCFTLWCRRRFAKSK